MAHRLLVVPTAPEVGLTSVCLGLVRALDQLSIRYAFIKPVGALDDRSTALVKLVTPLEPPAPIPTRKAEDWLGEGDSGQLLEAIVEKVTLAEKEADVVVVEGLVPGAIYAAQLNVDIARALDAELVLVGAPTSDDPVKIADDIDIASRGYGELTQSGKGLRCCILNRVPAEVDANTLRRAFDYEEMHVLGLVRQRPELGFPRVRELTEALGATVIHEGDQDGRRIERVSLCASTVRTAAETFEAGTLVITPGDREDIIVAACLACLEGAQLAGLLLTCGHRPCDAVMRLCTRALREGLPMLLVDDFSYPTANAVHSLSPKVPADDRRRADLVANTVAGYLDAEWLAKLASQRRATRMTTPAFRHQLIEQARTADRTIVLPEGDEPRTLQAARICAERELARCVLLGEPDRIADKARRVGVDLDHERIEVVDAREARQRFVPPMVELRKHKGLTEAMALDQLGDTVVLGTMMLAEGEVHGLVSGAVNTTANTIRPALQLLRTAPGATLVSSVFFMCLPEQVLVYGDCAVNPNPSDEELAEIAIQSADSAAAFGIEPRVAMISYSTGSSGAGADVAKVARATAIAKERRPDLLLDGPLQYDAAAIEEVGKKKAPESKVAGRATVFVFPDLNTGNTTYKAVQRSAHVVSMGPMLQGLRKPVNDLSRGALVEDIVFTIALTAIQASSI